MSITNETSEEFLERVAKSPIYDGCPSWCVNFGTDRADGDDHDGVHSASTFSAAGSRIFAQLERTDLHGMPRSTPNSEPYIALTQGDVDVCRMSVPEARSLARILVHLADLEEL